MSDRAAAERFAREEAKLGKGCYCVECFEAVPDYRMPRCVLCSWLEHYDPAGLKRRAEESRR